MSVKVDFVWEDRDFDTEGEITLWMNADSIPRIGDDVQLTSRPHGDSLMRVVDRTLYYQEANQGQGGNAELVNVQMLALVWDGSLNEPPSLLPIR